MKLLKTSRLVMGLCAVSLLASCAEDFKTPLDPKVNLPSVDADCSLNDLPAADELHITGLIHFNINVRDYPRSRDFYRAAGFTDQIGPFPETNTIEVSNGVGIDKLYRMHAELIHLGNLPDGPMDLTVPTGRLIDLIDWKDPERLEPPYSAINHLGITYFSLKTKDIDDHINRLVQAGATMVAGPVNETSGDRVAMVRDPDGTFMKLRQPLDSMVQGTEDKIDYLNINVRDFECSRPFYEMLGLEILDHSQSKDGGELTEVMGIGIETEKLGRMMQHRVDGFRVKLNQWVKPSAIGEPYPPPLTHLGIHRINWASSDLESDIETLKRHGVKFVSPIAPCCEGDASTFGFIIFEDPDGIYNQMLGVITPPNQSKGNVN
jgi:catechol 2,3-dioxygenase-like lactoylglutathione lyase family enzyme